MKALPSLAVTILLSITVWQSAYAQSDENRTKMQLTVVYNGKSIVTDLNSVNTSLSRSYDDVAPAAGVKDTAKTKIASLYPGAFYVTVDAKKVSDEMLMAFAKKQSHFDGTITIVDTYGKNPTRTIKFKQACIYSYSNQFSTASYGESYGASAISFSCKEVSINGINIEQ